MDTDNVLHKQEETFLEPYWKKSKMVLIPSIQDFPLEIEMTHYVPFKWSGKPPLPFIHMLSGLKLEEATRQNINYLEKC